MLSYSTVESYTLELLKALMQEELFSSLRLVGGTALALQYGHRQSVDLSFFDDADAQMMPVMCVDSTWDSMKAYLADVVKSYK